ncbi:iron complex transport system ATP-binding protein [Labrenzia sp. EL_208]|uniref:ATP-binding cassette domain-containing protein n=1 Tax=Roseibium album TaxID=311410 RepID=UPI000CF02FA5|nr:iron complex transport system ATP-binding protein [Labrenzia sp. EL_142]MBG6155454.1 iron complex transport system ATP-binding protein [Labrenzia sp. EL_162]MBG6176110.1 iron complex transport system ATP-binding protein [Labrenzia sp. EL_132]MBG6193989.1 iron complex transport system ATP-binding protein [Labrenzia sp. EL_159]MBG6201035.1 iron complex transport system ATP-binding protein [Labrenzia sp. EL_13]MBG6230725.1 iron complex transport system ATP-binding protein [Labrenzia sp. EL_208
MSALSAENISFSYGSRQIFDAIAFEPIVPGQLTALIGPNAAGKSTLFRLIAGLLPLQSGKVHLGNIDLDSLSTRARLKRVCFMPQFFTANAALTVFDVVMMAHKQLKGWRVSDADMIAVGTALHEAGIGHLAEAYVSELSGGQSQLVSVTQALIRNSDVYLFDEPTSALDLRHQLDVLGQIKSAVVRRGAVGVVALHDLNLAARFADNLILLGEGRILAQGSPRQVLRANAIAKTYGVAIETSQGPREELIVHAYAS